MQAPDHDEGRPPRTGPVDQLAAQAHRQAKNTAVMVDGATNVVLIPAEVAEVRGRTYSPLAVQLLDTERAADRLLEELGASHCRRLALALLELVQEVTR